MHRAIASYASGGAAPVLDDTTVLEQYGSLVERTAHRLISRTGLRSAYDDLWSAGAILPAVLLFFVFRPMIK